MKKIFTALVFCFSTYLSFAQIHEWSIGFDTGGNSDKGISTCVDNQGNIILVGSFSNNMDIDPAASVLELPTFGGEDAFIAKFTADKTLLWAFSFGGPAQDLINSACVDASNNIYVTGLFSGTIDIDPSEATTSLSSPINTDAFVIKFSEEGNLIWGKRFGAIMNDSGKCINLHPNGSVLVSGQYFGTVEFDENNENSILNESSMGGAFLMNLQEDGTFGWVKHLGVGTIENIAISNEHVHIIGAYVGQIDVNPSPNDQFLLSSYGIQDIFISKLNLDGTFVWGIRLGAPTADTPGGIAVDSEQNVYVTGSFAYTAQFGSTDVPFSLSSNEESTDIFFAKYNNNGQLLWASSVGSTDIDQATDIELLGENQIIVLAHSKRVMDADPSANEFLIGNNLSGYSPTIFRLSKDGEFIHSIQFNCTGNSSSSDLVSSNDGEIYFTGSFYQTMTPDPLNTDYNIQSNGFSDIYLVKLYEESGVVLETIEFDTQSQVVLFPNPSNHGFTLKGNKIEDYTIQIFSISGQCLLNRRVAYTNHFGAELPAGGYIVRVIDGDKVVSTKWIKE